MIQNTLIAGCSVPVPQTRIAVRVRLGGGLWHEVATFDAEDELKNHQAETVCEALCDLNPGAQCEFVAAHLGTAHPLKSYSAATGWRYGA